MENLERVMEMLGSMLGFDGEAGENDEGGDSVGVLWRSWRECWGLM